MIENILSEYEGFSWLIACSICFAYIITDALYAYYTLAVAEHKALRAANTGALLHFLIALGVLSYVENYLYIIPIAIGSWVGTYLLVNKDCKE
jgi:hypothetical protein